MNLGTRTIFAGLLCLLAASCANSAGRMNCDRACLMQAMNAYLAALQSGDFAQARLARSVRATRNGAEIEPGAMRFDALGDVQRFYADPVAGQAAYLGVIEEASGPALTAIRIRIEDGDISEIEQFIARHGDTLFSIEGFRALAPRAAPPPGARRPRADMIAAANSYFEGLSTHASAVIRHVPGCERLENGTRVTNRPPRQAASGAQAGAFQARDCAAGMETMTQIREVAFRRFPLVDEEAGIVMGVALFLRPPGQSGTFARRNLLTEFFELEEGRISGIYAVMHYLDPETPDGTGWP